MVRCMAISLVGFSAPLSLRPSMSTITMSSGLSMPLLNPVGVARTRFESNRKERFPSVAATKPWVCSILPYCTSSWRSCSSSPDAFLTKGRTGSSPRSFRRSLMTATPFPFLVSPCAKVGERDVLPREPATQYRDLDSATCPPGLHKQALAKPDTTLTEDFALHQ